MSITVPHRFSGMHDSSLEMGFEEESDYTSMPHFVLVEKLKEVFDKKIDPDHIREIGRRYGFEVDPDEFKLDNYDGVPERDIPARAQPGYNMHQQHISSALFIETLTQSQAILAGGFVVGAYAGFDSDDLDIYVNARHGRIILRHLLQMGYILSNKLTLVPAYDLSFFRKNHINARFRFVHVLQRPDLHYKAYPDIDVMLVQNEVDIRQVVTHFDLTFCQAWFDGNSVKATHPQDILRKHGRLQDDYAESLFTHMNQFIIGRIQKYKKRGFKIDIRPPAATTVSPSINTSNAEEWIVKKLYNDVMCIMMPINQDEERELALCEIYHRGHVVMYFPRYSYNSKRYHAFYFTSTYALPSTGITLDYLYKLLPDFPQIQTKEYKMDMFLKWMEGHNHVETYLFKKSARRQIREGESNIDTLMHNFTFKMFSDVYLSYIERIPAQVNALHDPLFISRAELGDAFVLGIRERLLQMIHEHEQEALPRRNLADAFDAEYPDEKDSDEKEIELHFPLSRHSTQPFDESLYRSDINAIRLGFYERLRVTDPEELACRERDSPFYDTFIVPGRTYRQFCASLWKHPLAVSRRDEPLCMQVHNAVRNILNPFYAFRTLTEYRTMYPRYPTLTDTNLLLATRDFFIKYTPYAKADEVLTCVDPDYTLQIELVGNTTIRVFKQEDEEDDVDDLKHVDDVDLPHELVQENIYIESIKLFSKEMLLIFPNDGSIWGYDLTTKIIRRIKDPNRTPVDKDSVFRSLRKKQVEQMIDDMVYKFEGVLDSLITFYGHPDLPDRYEQVVPITSSKKGKLTIPFEPVGQGALYEASVYDLDLFKPGDDADLYRTTKNSLVIESDANKRYKVIIKARWDIPFREVLSTFVFFMMDHAPRVIMDWMVLLIKSVFVAYNVPIEHYVYGETDISCPAGILERMLLECQNIFCPDIPFIYSMSETIKTIWIKEMDNLPENDSYLSDVKEEEKQSFRASRDALWDNLVRRRIKDGMELKGGGKRPYTQEEIEIIHSLLDHPKFAFEIIPSSKGYLLGKRVKRTRKHRARLTRLKLNKRKKSIHKRKKSIHKRKKSIKKIGLVDV
jgi:hypothetical protein